MHRVSKYIVLPAPPLIDDPLRTKLLEYLDETYTAKTRGMGTLCDEKRCILHNLNLQPCLNDRPVWQIDRQRVGR